MNITVIGAGYVGLSLATLLSTRNHVTIYEINEAKVKLINSKKSPIRDDYIEKYFLNEKIDTNYIVLKEVKMMEIIRIIIMHGLLIIKFLFS